MRSVLPSFVLFVGVCLACVGVWWVWTGLDIVQVERGWSAVIAGATMLSAGLVIAVLAAVLVRLGDIADAAYEPAAVVPRLTARQEVARPARIESEAAAPQDEHFEMSNGVDRNVVGRHVAGDATYVMFADGSVEAQTPDGTMAFPSLDALRAYADEREAANERNGSERS